MIRNNQSTEDRMPESGKTGRTKKTGKLNQGSEEKVLTICQDQEIMMNGKIIGKSGINRMKIKTQQEDLEVTTIFGEKTEKIGTRNKIMNKET